MKYYTIAQDKSFNGLQITMSSLPNEAYNIADLVTVPTVRVFSSEGVEIKTLEAPAPKYGDIISGASSIYSDRICDVIRTLNLPIYIKPVSLLVHGSGDSEPATGYNLVLRVPDVDCIKEDSDTSESIEIDEALASGNPFFDLDGFTNVRVIDETVKTLLDELDLEGIYCVPLDELNEREMMFLKY